MNNSWDNAFVSAMYIFYDIWSFCVVWNIILYKVVLYEVINIECATNGGVHIKTEHKTVRDLGNDMWSSFGMIGYIPTSTFKYA